MKAKTQMAQHGQVWTRVSKQASWYFIAEFFRVAQRTKLYARIQQERGLLAWMPKERVLRNPSDVQAGVH